MLVRESVSCKWLVDVVHMDSQLEDVMWVRLQHKESAHVVNIAVCYFPPAGSSREVDIEERFQVLEEQVNRFELEGEIVVCGDFNARCGGLSDISLMSQIDVKLI